MRRHTGRIRQTLLVAGLVLVGISMWSWISLAENTIQATDVPERVLRIDPAYAELTEPLPPGAPTGIPEHTAAVPLSDKETDLADSEERVSVLVWFEPNVGFAAVERADVKQFASNQGAFTRYEYKTVLPDVINLRNVPVSMLENLKAKAGVAKVEMDVYHPNLVRLDESTPRVRALESQLSAAGLPYDGTGVRLCVADTGIDMDHIMYTDRIDTAASWDFVNNDNNPDDDQGHGSHVAGIAVGRTGLTVDFGCEGTEPLQGMAPGATLIGAKILNSFGGGTDSDIIAGIDHCADQSASGGRADVINLSIGTGNYSSGACTHSWAVASNNAVANGVVVVAASGNEHNSNSMGSPACGADVIAVGATYKDDYPNCEDSTSTFNWGDCVDSSPSRDDIVCFSNQSDYLDVSAPGSVIQSASNSAGGTSVTGKSGTSMASPMVAGLAALVLDADPTLTPAQVRQILRDGAIDLGPAGFDRAYGYGHIDAINTLNELEPCTGDGDCDDGMWCNGSETCNAGSCVAGTPACAGGICDEATDSCSTLAHEWEMNSNPGWTMTGDWAYGQPTGGGGEHGGPDPTAGATGANVVGYDLSGDYGANLAETHMTTTAINCSGLTNVTLRFQRWLGVEQPTYDHAYLRVSNNGSTWTTIWENSSEITDSAWSQQEFDISAVADNQSTVYIRWTMGATDGSWFYCGWNIDDVQIFASGGGPTCSDGILNQGETRIDCGGPCPACNCTSNGVCDDGQFCNGTESCDSYGNCQAGSAVDCDDGQYCNGAETCDDVAGCQSGTAVSCDDGVDCTGDSCNEGTDACDNTPNDAACDDGQYCNGAETCDPLSDCQAGSDPCPGQSCDEAGDVCVECTIDTQCDDGLYCNGAETCNAGSCQAGAPPVCSDGVGCTTDTCNEGTDSCDFVPVNAACDDGQYCNGVETCDALSDCQAGGDPCIGLFCDEGIDVCLECLIDGDCDDGLFCNGAETCAAGLCQSGGDPCPGQTCNEGTDTCESTTVVARIESGTVNVAGTAATVTLTNSYVSPVVVCSLQYNNNTTPVVVRVDNVTGTSFDVWVQNPGGGPVLAENVSYVVVEEGTWTIDGVNVEAQTYLSTVTDENNSWVGEAQTYGQAYTNPVVIGQVMTANDAGWSAFWSHNGARVNPPTPSLLYTGKMVAEDTDVTRADETVGFIVFEAGHGTIGGVEFEALVGADTVAGPTNSPPYSYTFNTAFASPPAVTVTTLTAMDGNNGGWAQTHGPTAATNTTLYLSIDEDVIGDTERSHTTEQVAYLVFESAFAYEAAPECTIDPDCDDGLFCNGPESCFEGSCLAGAPITCDDGVGCTTDTCVEAGDTCSNVATDSVCDDGLYCNGAETCDAVSDCQAGSDPCPGGTCDEVGDVCDSPGGAQLESVNVVVGEAEVTVALTHTYTSPVIVCSAQYSNNTAPIVTRINDVTATSFDVRLQAPAGNAVAAENVTCLVVEEGSWTVDGVAIEAQTYLSTVTDDNNSWVGEAQTYGQSYVSPVVLGQVMSENDTNWSVFWCQGSARTNPPSATALRTGKEVAEDTLITRADETVGFIVIEAGHGTIAGVEYEAALGADSVRGVGNSPPYTYTFGTAFSTAPSVVMTTMAGMDGGNGGWSQQHGATYSTASGIYLSVDEDTINDTERAHTPEQVGYVVFETAVSYP